MLLRALFRPSSAALRPARNVHPTVECLEGRTLPAVIVPLSGSLQAQLSASVSGTVGPVGVSGPSSSQSGTLAATAISLPMAGISAPTTLDSIALQGTIADNFGLYGINPNAGSINGQTTVTVDAVVGQQATHGQQFSTAFQFLYALSGTSSNTIAVNPLNTSATFAGKNLVFAIQADPADGLLDGMPVVVNFNAKTGLNSLPAAVSLSSTASILSNGVSVPIQNNGGLNPSGVFVTTVGSTFEVQGSVALSASGNVPAGSFSYAGTGLTLTLTVTSATPTVSVTAGGGSYRGTPYTASASVNGSTSLEGVSPVLTYYAGTYTDVSQLQGLTPLDTAPSVVGSYTVLASFPGSADYLSASALGNFAITPAATANRTAASASSPAYGQTVTFRATVTDTQTRAAPSGSVEFFDGSTDLGPGTLLSAGGNSAAWTWTTSSLAAGSHAIQAVFSSDSAGDFGPSSSLALGQVVNKATPGFTPNVPAVTTAAAAIVVSGRLGTSTAVPPAGELVAITLNGVTQSAALDGSGNFTTSFAQALAAGSYLIRYSYGGDANFNAASGSSTLTVTRAVPTFSNLSGPTITYGTPSVTVSGQLGAGTLLPAAGETVRVTLNGVSQSAPLDPTGAFATTFASNLLRAGTHPVSFSYHGDASLAAASGSSTLTVQKATPAFSNLSGPTISYGTASVTVSGELGSDTIVPPAGEVVRVTLNGVTHLAPLNRRGGFSTNFATGARLTGTYSISYAYHGDANWLAASGTSTLTVTAATPVFRRLSAPSILVGTASVLLSGRLVAGPVSPPANEVVSVTLNGVTQPATLNRNGTFAVRFATDTLTTGAYTIQYSFSGDADFNSALGSSTLTVLA
jgi:hypothetical protein